MQAKRVTYLVTRAINGNVYVDGGRIKDGGDRDLCDAVVVIDDISYYIHLKTHHNYLMNDSVCQEAINKAKEYLPSVIARDHERRRQFNK